MKIQFVSLLDHTASTGRRIFSLAKNLAKQGEDVEFLSFAWKKTVGSQRKEDKEIEGVKIKYVYVKNSKLEIMLKGTRALLKLLDKNSDICHISKALPIHSIPFYMAKKFKKAKLVLDLDDWEGVGGASSFPKTGLKQAVLITIMEERLMRKADGFTGASKILESRAKNAGQKNTLYLPNGADPAFFEPSAEKKRNARKELGIPLSEKVFVYVGTVPKSLSSVSFMLRAAQKVQRNFRIIIVGHGEGLEDAKKLCKELGIERKTMFTGKADHEQVPKYLWASDCALIPYSDKFPESLYNRARCSLKVYEYMAAGLPVIASNIGELKQALSFGLFPADDEKEFRRQMREVLLLPEQKLKKIGEENRKKIIGFYNYEVQAKRLLEFYKKIVKNE